MARAIEIEGLDCEQDTFSNIDLILRARLDEMCRLKAKALDWSNIEGVHAMRVASRRLRSALNDFAPYINERRAPRRELREIARSLGAVRDQDVVITALEKLQHKASEEVAAGITLFIEERRKRQAVARDRLMIAISDEALNQLQEKFVAWLQRAATNRGGNLKNSSGGLTFRGMGLEVILSRYRELEGLSLSLFSPFDVEPLHRMRIAAKGLRYSLELFSNCFGKRLTEFAKEVAKLQTSLGELHDYDVWIEEPGARLKAQDADVSGQEIDGAQSQRLTEHAAAIWLLRYFVKERTKHYTNALSRWSRWKAAGFYSSLSASLQEELSARPPAASL